MYLQMQVVFVGKGDIMSDCYTDISTLPDGTFFHVNNGCWNGYITTEDGVKVCYAGVSRKNPTEHYINKFPLDHEHKLDIDIL